MAGDLLGIGVSALLANQRVLNTIGHNIANVNTDGYTRQRVDLATRTPTPAANGFIGNGVNAIGVDRIYNQFVVDQVRRNVTAESELAAFSDLTRQIDDLLGDAEVGLSPSLQSFFNSLEELANDPASVPARQVVLSEAESLANRFEYMDSRLNDVQAQVNGQMRSAVAEINTIADAIAQLNQDIQLAEGIAGGQPANDLRDQRDLLVKELAEHTSVNVVEQENGAYNVFIGSGQSLVVGNQSFQLQTRTNALDPSTLDVWLGNATGGGQVNVTANLSGGAIGGLLGIQDEVLTPARNSLGRLAVSMSIAMNDQHQLGMDLNGSLGGLFFSDLTAQQALAGSNNDAATDYVLTSTVTDVGRLSTSDYRIDYNAGTYSVRRLSDDAVVATSGSPNIDLTATEGFAITGVGTSISDGDSFLLRPTNSAAREFGVALDSVDQIAAASPVRVGEATTATGGALNTGTGVIGAVEIVDASNAAFTTAPGALTPPLIVSFTGPSSYEIINADTSAVLDTGTYDPAVGEDLFPSSGSALDFGYRARITGNPAAGDQFVIEYNSGGTGDNRNALQLSGLRDELIMENGTASFQNSYAQFVAEVGTRSRQTDINLQAAQTLRQQAESAHQSISGVNLDEEAANLIKFQQAYQASAQVISVTSGLFQSLLFALRG